MLSITTDKIPTSQMIAQAIDRDLPITVQIIRKGGKTGELLVPVSLAQATRDYIEFERAEIVSRFKRKKAGYIEPNEVFLSSTTGRVLSRNSLTRISISRFRAAGVLRSSFHQLRSKKAKDSLRVLMAENRNHATGEGLRSETVIASILADMMGHQSPTSLMPYIREYLDQESRNSDHFKEKDLAATIRVQERMSAEFEKRLSTQRLRARAMRDTKAELLSLIENLDDRALDGIIEGVRDLIGKISPRDS